MLKIRIEKVGDIRSKYSYLEVFEEGSQNPFLDISVNNDKQLSYKFYASENDIELSTENMDHIVKTASVHLKQAIADEDSYNDWMNKQ